MKVRIKSINVLAVYVSDLENAKVFYTGILGFEEVDKVPPGILLKSGDVTLYMEPGRSGREFEARDYPEFSPCFETDGVRKTYEALKASGVEIVEDYTEYGPSFALFKISDTEGNLIEFAGEP